MAVQVQQPTRKKRDIFDVLLGGLQAASAFTNIQKGQAELEALPEAKARLARAEEIKIGQTFQPAEPGTKGAISLPGKEGLFVPRTQAKATAERAKDTRKLLLGEFTKVQDKLSKDKGFQRAAGQVWSGGTLLNLGEEAKKGNQAAFEQMKVVIARMNQGGVLTDRDIETLGGSREFLQIFDRFKEQRLVGDVRPEDIEDLLGVASAARSAGLETAQRIREGHVNRSFNRFEAAGLKVDRKTLEDITEINDLIEETVENAFPERTTPVRRAGILPKDDGKTIKKTLDEQLDEFRDLINVVGPLP